MMRGSMRLISALFIVASFSCAFEAFGQSPLAVQYCQDLTATYRKAVSGGKPVVPGVGQAIADCPTNPNDSIFTLEAALKKMDVALPPR